MSGLLQDLAEAALSEATLLLFTIFGADNFPEFYVQEFARTPMVRRLYLRMNWDRLDYRGPAREERHAERKARRDIG